MEKIIEVAIQSGAQVMSKAHISPPRFHASHLYVSPVAITGSPKIKVGRFSFYS